MNFLRKLVQSFSSHTPASPVDVLFLDFDGVLHPVSGGFREFSQVSLLSPLFEENPLLRIVVTSDWRASHPEPELQECLGDLRDYYLGSTPLLENLRQPNFHGDPLIPFSRQREILWFLSENSQVRNWLVLDDIPSLYEDNFRARHVLLTDPRTGLTQRDILSASQILQSPEA